MKGKAKPKKGRVRRIIAILLALFLIWVGSGIEFLVAILILLGVGLDALICSAMEKKNRPPQLTPEMEDAMQKVFDSVRSTNAREDEYRKTVDLRQFKGRNDVTRKEVADHLWFHLLWEGRREKEIICEEISKVSNINQDDIDWILHEHYNHKGNDGSLGGGCWIRNEKVRKQIEQSRQKTIEFDKEIERESKRLGLEDDNKMKDSYKFIFYYEDWLKDHGYSDGAH